jgi:DDE_Tnp_1-associated
MKAAGIAIDQEHYRKGANAKDIDLKTYTSRQHQDYLKPEEVLECEKFRIQDTYGMSVTPELVEQDDGAILSVIAGAKGWEDMENYGLSKYEWLEQFLKLPEGIPSADTFRRVFERIDAKVFEQCFRRWVESIVENTGAQVIPIDGKTLVIDGCFYSLMMHLRVKI